MRLDDIVDRLRDLPLFARVEVEALRLLAFSATRRSLRPGDRLFRKGDSGDAAYMILAGAMVIDEHDNGAPSAAILGPGVLIGAHAMFALVERPVSVLARDHTTVLTFPRELMTKVIEAYPKAAETMRISILEEARSLQRTLETLAL